MLNILAWYTFVLNILALMLTLFMGKDNVKRFVVVLFQAPVITFLCMYLFGK